MTTQKSTINFIQPTGTVTVKDLITKLLEHSMDYEVVIRDKKGKRLRNVSINSKEQEGFGVLFG